MLQTAGEEAHPQLQLQQELLPYEALVCMLQYVDLPTRLTSCALVCSTWAAAAVKATYAVHLRDVTEQRLTSLLRWLRRSRACLNAVSLHHDAADPLMLQLWDLIDALHEPHGLLQLSVCNVLCLAGSLTALNRCDRLQRLELLSVTAPEGLSPLVFPGTLLLDLPHLTALHLGPGLLIDSGSLQHLGSLKGLQQLQIHGCQHLSAEDLAPIASLRQLKYLALAGVPRLPELQRLTGLRHLALTACQEGLQPTVLSALTGLQQLDLADTCVQGHDLGLGTQQLMLANKVRRVGLSSSSCDCTQGWGHLLVEVTPHMDMA